jgi:hypothetical protein
MPVPRLRNLADMGSSVLDPYWLSLLATNGKNR